MGPKPLSLQLSVTLYYLFFEFLYLSRHEIVIILLLESSRFDPEYGLLISLIYPYM